MMGADDERITRLSESSAEDSSSLLAFQGQVFTDQKARESWITPCWSTACTT